MAGYATHATVSANGGRTITSSCLRDHSRLKDYKVGDVNVVEADGCWSFGISEFYSPSTGLIANCP